MDKNILIGLLFGLLMASSVGAITVDRIGAGDRVIVTDRYNMTIDYNGGYVKYIRNGTTDVLTNQQSHVDNVAGGAIYGDGITTMNATDMIFTERFYYMKVNNTVNYVDFYCFDGLPHCFAYYNSSVSPLRAVFELGDTGPDYYFFGTNHSEPNNGSDLYPITADKGFVASNSSVASNPTFSLIFNNTESLRNIWFDENPGRDDLYLGRNAVGGAMLNPTFSYWFGLTEYNISYKPELVYQNKYIANSQVANYTGGCTPMEGASGLLFKCSANTLNHLHANITREHANQTEGAYFVIDYPQQGSYFPIGATNSSTPYATMNSTGVFDSYNVYQTSGDLRRNMNITAKSPHGNVTSFFWFPWDASGNIEIKSWMWNPSNVSYRLINPDIMTNNVSSTFIMEFNGTSGVNDINASFNYNGNYYASSEYKSSNDYVFTVVLPASAASGNSSNVFWNYSVGVTGQKPMEAMTAYKSITIYTTNILGLCDPGDTVALNFSIWNEENTTTPLISVMEIALDIWTADYAINTTFANTYQGNSTYELCKFTNVSNIYYSGTVKYYMDGFASRYYYFKNAQLTGQADIKLYLLNDTVDTMTTFRLIDIVGNEETDVIVKANKYYIGEDVYRLVSMGRSDVEGFAKMPLKQDEWYRFITERDGVIIKQFDPMNLIDATVTLELPIGESIEFFEYFDSVATACTWTNSTQRLTCSWSDTSGKLQRMHLIAEIRQPVGNWLRVCEQTTTTSSGTLSCDLAPYQQKMISYYLRGTHCCSDTTYVVYSNGQVDNNTDNWNIGIIGVFAALCIVITLTFMGLYNPTMSLSLMLLGVAISQILHLVLIDWEFIIGLALAAGVIMFKSRA